MHNRRRQWTFVWIFVATVVGGCGGAKLPSGVKSAAAPPKYAYTRLADLAPAVARPPARPTDTPDDPQVTALLAAGRTHLDNDQPAEAVAAMLRAAELAGDSLSVRRELAMTLLACGEADKALPHLRAVAADDIPVQLALGRQAEEAGLYDEATVRYRTALICTPRSADDTFTLDETRIALSELLAHRGRFVAALDAMAPLEANLCSRWAQAQPETLTHLAEMPESLLLRQGAYQLELGRFAQAAESLEAAWRLNKTYATPAELLIETLVRSRRFDQAERIGIEMLSGPLEPAAIAKMLASVCKAQGDQVGLHRLLETYQERYGAIGARMAVELARATRELGAINEAIDMLAESVDNVEQPAPVCLTLAQWLFAQSRPEEAVDALALVLTKEPASARPVRSLILRMGRGAFGQTLSNDLADSARSAESDRAARYYLAGLLAVKFDKPDEAQDHFDRAIESAVTFAPAYEELARIAISGSRFDRVADLADALDAAGQSAAGDYLRGWAMLAQGNAETAVASLTRAVEADEELIAARVMFGRALLKTNQLTEAVGQLNEAVGLYYDGEAADMVVSLLVREAQQHRAAGRSEQAQRSLDLARRTIGHLLNHDQNDPQALFLLGTLQHRQGQYLQALRTVDRLIAEAPDAPSVRLLRVTVEGRAAAAAELLSARRYERARADLEAIVQADPGNLKALRMLADTHFGARNYAAAAEAYQRALMLIPGSTELVMRRATALGKAGLISEAVEALSPSLVGSVNMRTRVLYALLLSELGRDGDALRHLRLWVASGDGMALAYRVAMIRVFAQAGDGDAALDLADELLAGQVDQRQADAILAARLDALATLGRGHELIAVAVEAFTAHDADHWLGDAGLSNTPRAVLAAMAPVADRAELRPLIEAETPIDLASALLAHAGDYDRAESIVVAQIERLSAGAAAEKDLAADLGRRLIERMLVGGRTKKARKLYEQWLASVGEDNLGFVLMAEAVFGSSDRGRVERIESLMQRAMELDADDLSLGNNLAYSWIDRGVKLDEAQRLLEKAMTVESSPAVQDSMGWLHYKRGQFRQALDFLLLALNSPYGDNSVIFDHVGDAYWRLGRDADAIRMWREAADLAELELELNGELLDADSRRVARETPKKIEAAQRGLVPTVAPLGEGVRP